MENFKLPMSLSSSNSHERTVVHIDIDCFYAQVEMIRNPELCDKPLGIQQKNIVVTCNYIARQYGVNKLMSIADAYKHCPTLVLVSGEDLTHYRAYSNKVTELLQTRFSPTVERLGFDENFVDISKLVATRMVNNDHGVVGYVYGTPSTDENTCKCGCSQRLIIGSQLAAEMRKTIYDELGLTTCAGISYNKLLAKLVGSVHKPNQQTTLFHSQALEMINQLPSVRAIPGIGRQTAECLKNKLAVSSIESMQACSIEQLTEALGSQDIAKVILKLSFGIDDSDVKESGKPQSIGLEDAFKEVRTLEDVEEKLGALLVHLLELLLNEDPPRNPGTLRVSVRKFHKNWQESNRESRQCSIPTLPLDDSNKCKQKLMPLVMELFRKMVNPTVPFHLTLLGIAFTNLTEPKRGKASILTFMEPASKKPKLPQETDSNSCQDQETPSSTFSNCESNASTSAPKVQIPPWVDAGVFQNLPPNLQQEILEDWNEQKQPQPKNQIPKGKPKNSIDKFFK